MPESQIHFKGRRYKVVFGIDGIVRLFHGKMMIDNSKLSYRQIEHLREILRVANGGKQYAFEDFSDDEQEIKETKLNEISTT